MTLLYLVGMIAKKVVNFVRRIGLVAVLLLTLALLVVGVRGAETRSNYIHDDIVCDRLSDIISRLTVRPARESLYVLRLPGGYNGRGFCWIGDARIDTVFDTGSTRNSVSKDYLKALLTNEKTSGEVRRIIDIEPLVCTSMEASSRITVKQLAVINTTFRADGMTDACSLDIAYLVIGNSSEDLLLGKPTLDELGFVSDKHSIELRSLGLRFPTVLPPDSPRHRGEYMLKCADHYALTAPPGQTRSRIIEVVPSRHIAKDTWWAGPGPDLPDGVQLVEGPVTIGKNGRISVEVLIHESTRVGPGQAVVEVTPMTEKHEKITKAVSRMEKECAKQVQEKEQLLAMCCKE